MSFLREAICCASLSGLWVAMKISLVSILISLPLGVLVGALMTVKNRVVKVIFRVYLEIIRIMPQLVLLFIVYFGTTRALGWNLSGEVASVIVFVLWGNGGDGRPRAWGTHQYSKASV